MNDQIKQLKKASAPLGFLSAFLIIVMVSACSFSKEKKEGPNEQNIPAENLAEVTVPIEGMTCNACVASVKKKLASLEGIREVQVSLVNRNATVLFEHDAVTKVQIREAINDLGYKAGNPITETQEE